MEKHKRPYIVIPFFVEQPTWGGRYILREKQWEDKPEFVGKKIGQSYELYSKTRLATTLSTTDNPQFTADTNITQTSLDSVLAVELTHGILPLIKFTQARGNSFQLHKKPDNSDPNWQPKAESWYYFEPGKITFGIKKGQGMDSYRAVCHAINTMMKELSSQVKSGKLGLDEARSMADKFIQEKNPWQFVNVHTVPRDGVVDLSGGGLHHSWEEDSINCPLGNVLYEVQQDVMDPTSTIRSFDQGKIMEDGSIRTIHVDDYFKHLDIDEERNTLSLQPGDDGILFDSPHYKLRKSTVQSETEILASTSFHHVFVKSGKIAVSAGGVRIIVGRGHSCFVPKDASYVVVPEEKSVLLTTYL